LLHLRRWRSWKEEMPNNKGGFLRFSPEMGFLVVLQFGGMLDTLLIQLPNISMYHDFSDMVSDI
jgi:hypothetical protein